MLPGCAVAAAQNGCLQADQVDPVLDEIVRRLVSAYQPERVYLFGSHARGDQHEHSDYHLMVVVPEDAPARRRKSRLGYEALRGTGVAVDVLVWSHEAFASHLGLRASLPDTVVAEGRPLYGASPRCRQWSRRLACEGAGGSTVRRALPDRRSAALGGGHEPYAGCAGGACPGTA
ncbi:MAG TPA: nucleotidyltransferase domain-containing protein [Armatimonadota bacterium]